MKEHFDFCSGWKFDISAHNLSCYKSGHVCSHSGTTVNSPRGVRVMVFNATFNNISVLSLRSVLLVEKTGYPQKTTDLPQVTDTLYSIMLYQVHLVWVGFELTTKVVIGTDRICSCKSNYHQITTVPELIHAVNLNTT